MGEPVLMPVAFVGPDGSIRAVPPGEMAAILKDIKACEYRSAGPDAGCGCSVCALSKGRAGIVSHLDCIQCRRPSDPRFRPRPAPPPGGPG